VSGFGYKGYSRFRVGDPVQMTEAFRSSWCDLHGVLDTAEPLYGRVVEVTDRRGVRVQWVHPDSHELSPARRYNVGNLESADCCYCGEYFTDGGSGTLDCAYCDRGK
jgi:hypothetical protein